MHKAIAIVALFLVLWTIKCRAQTLEQNWESWTPDSTNVVIVHWSDIQDTPNWNVIDEVRPARHLQTVGWILYAGEDLKDAGHNILVIARTYDAEEGRWAEYTVFPAGVVKRVERFRVR